MACKFKKNDYIIDVGTKEIYFVINTLNDVVFVRKEENDECLHLTASFVNRFCSKVDLETATLLYKDDKDVRKDK